MSTIALALGIGIAALLALTAITVCLFAGTANKGVEQ